MTNKVKLSDYLSKEELTHFSAANDLRAWGIFFTTWGMIAGAFAMAIIWPNPLTFLLAILILGGRQLGLGVINHDCAHYAFFSNKKLNDFVGHWLSGSAINTSVHAYRAYHLKHHKYAGTPDDPDKWMVKDYPITRERLKRKLMRDITGRTGIRDTWKQLKAFSFKKNTPWFTFHVLLLGTLTAVGAPWAYLLWWAANLTAYPTIVRIRQIGEHGVAINRDSLDPRENTGTTLVSWWERMFIGPNFVNFHLEHHHFAAVPGYNLPKLHALLKSRGYYEGYDCIAKGYIDVLRRASSKPAEGAPHAAQAA